MNDDARLADALRRLPPQVPSTDLFPRVAARARQRAQRRRLLRHAVPLALAAGVVLAVLWPRGATRDLPAVPTPTVSAAPAAAQLAVLRRHSQQLQDWVGQLARDGGPLGTAALADATELEDRIALVDLQLGAGGDTRTQTALWNRRIALLEQLGMLRSTSGRLAASSAAVRAQPTIWID